MARRHKHEEHANHEAWAIPYGDLVTLLLAFFVVMYAMSSVNEGKYRVLSDSLVAAFQGSPRSMEPVQVGQKQVGSGADIKISIVEQTMLSGQPRSMLNPLPIVLKNEPQPSGSSPEAESQQASDAAGDAEAPHTADAANETQSPHTQEALQALESVAQEVERAMSGLIEENLIVVRRHGLWVEVEIRTDILFTSGVATLSADAVKVMQQLAATLKPFPNPIRVEGHTDNRPISTRAFPSNWELSSARAASVVHVFTRGGIKPERLAVIGLGEHRPSQSNVTPAGRNANRRVLLVILSGDGMPEGDYAEDRGKPEDPASAPPPPVVDAAVTPVITAITAPP